MSVRDAGMAAGSGRRGRPSVLDVAAEVLVADPAASLAEVAAAAGIGRTTLHKHYATREDLLCAVGHRAIDLWEQAVDAAGGAGDRDGGLRALAGALIAIGPQLAFLWRTPVFDHIKDLDNRWIAAEQRCVTVLKRAQDHGLLAAGLPEWWLMQTFYAVIYTAAESVQAGKLAPLDAPDLALRTFLHGVGAAPKE
ncbi:MAG TPA: TetR family transcriptional regulator [Streptosporangiaceae bacterium]|jgi:AcrR family transcriptional regulator